MQLNWSIPQQNKQAQDYLRQAIRKDPNCSELYVQLAQAQEWLGQFRLVPPEEAYGPAKQLLGKALELNDKHCLAYWELAELDWRYEWNWKDAEKALRTSAQVCPNEDFVHGNLAYYLAWAGRKDEALAEISKFRELDPTFSEPLYIEALVNYHLRNYKVLTEVCREYVISDPDNWAGYYWLGVGRFGANSRSDSVVSEIGRVIAEQLRYGRFFSVCVCDHGKTGRSAEDTSRFLATVRNCVRFAVHDRSGLRWPRQQGSGV